MPLKNVNVVSFLTLIGAILMMANGLWVFFNNGPIIISTYGATTLSEAWPSAPSPSSKFWGRIVLGFPGLVEGGIAAFWIAFAFFLLLLSIVTYVKPRRQKGTAPLLFICSILTIPIGAGFIIGLALAIIGALLAFEWPTPYEETVIGTILNTFGIRSKSLKTAIEKQTLDVKKAILIIMLIFIMSSVGNTLYSFNVGKIYPQSATTLVSDAKPGDLQIFVANTSGFQNGDYIFIGIRDKVESRQVGYVGDNYISVTVALKYGHAKDEKVTSSSTSFDPTAAYDILLHGKLYVDYSILTINVLSYIIVGIIKWLTIAVIAYILCIKLPDRQISFTQVAVATSLIFVPEILNAFMPILFCNEPMLSIGTAIALIPFSWPMLVFYVTHVWSFLILASMLGNITESDKWKALGSALASCALYFLIVYWLIAPLVNISGFRITFTQESYMPLLSITSLSFIISWLLGAFKKT